MRLVPSPALDAVEGSADLVRRQLGACTLAISSLPQSTGTRSTSPARSTRGRVHLDWDCAVTRAGPTTWLTAELDDAELAGVLRLLERGDGDLPALRRIA